MSAKTEAHLTPAETPTITRENGLLVVSDRQNETLNIGKLTIWFACLLLPLQFITMSPAPSMLFLLTVALLVLPKSLPVTKLVVDPDQCKIRIGVLWTGDESGLRVLDFADVQEIAVIYDSDIGYLPYLLLRTGEDVLCPSRGASQEEAEHVAEVIRVEMAQAKVAELQ
ncbi:MAG: hypothetical protein ABL893_11845 [Hyphomicrobium sp.]|nr:hypothetical protein [Hyphomicrobium sp.]